MMITVAMLMLLRDIEPYDIYDCVFTARDFPHIHGEQYAS
jgi:hypothetical protein